MRKQLLTRIFLFASIGSLALTGCFETPTAQSQKGQTGGVDPLQSYSAKAATPDSLIKLPVKSNWQRLQSPKFDVVYKGEPGDAYYVRRIGDALAPELGDLEAIRKQYREACIAENGGILSVEVQDVQGNSALVYYSKQVVSGVRGYRYIARCVLQTPTGWQEVRMDAIQMGMSGMRESMATMSLSKMETEAVPDNAAPTPGSRPKQEGEKQTRLKGFFLDPYDETFNDQAMNSIADDKKYDAKTPKHPLSRIRKTFPALLQQMTVPN